MLQITIPEMEAWDEVHNEFVHMKGQTLQLEHSLVSLSKWESKWCKPFLSIKEKTAQETLDYIKCMTITQNVDDSVYARLSQANIIEINKYIEAPMSATKFFDPNRSRGGNESITSEKIYSWMVSLQIPFECQKWHINRLMNLIRLLEIANGPKKKMSQSELASRNAALNAARRQQLNSKG